MGAAPGTGILEVVHTPARSVVSRAFAASPLRLLTPRSHGHAAWVYTSSYGGGLVGGDALALTVSVGAGATAFLSTQASTKAYGSPAGARSDIDAVVAGGARLVVWPDPVVCYAGSTYRQRQHFELSADAALLVVDWMTSGRRASGERWRFHRYSTRLTVRYDSRLVLLDGLSLSADEGELEGRMGRFDVLCTAALVGPALAVHGARIVEEAARVTIQRSASILTAASRLGDTGAIVRIAGASVEEVARVLRARLAFVPGLLGDDPWSRKW